MIGSYIEQITERDIPELGADVRRPAELMAWLTAYAAATGASQHLNWLEGRIGDALLDKVVVTTGEFAYRLEEGTAVVPLGLLGP
ncbi:MAG: hypothetical protein LBJ62_04420 [Bifidobacteriaceae bacterium]|jgi:hypothetical protein|nr:hypothetical protein [Bifidobacteriaceae bacterium]